MAFDRAIVEHPRTGQIRQAPVGFSWTMFLFGFWAPLIRGDGKWAAIVFISTLVAAVVSIGFLGWVPNLIAAFIWNKSYLNRLISDGFHLKATEKGSSLDRVDGVLGYTAPRAYAMAA